MSLLLICAELALFWGVERSNLIDTEAAQLYWASGYLSSQEKRLYHYRLRGEGEAEGRRRRSWIEESQGGAFKVIDPDEERIPEGEDERLILSFRGEQLSLIRSLRQPEHRSLELRSLRLPGGARLRSPPGFEPAYLWLRGRLPELLPQIPLLGRLELESPGGALRPWLILGESELLKQPLAPAPQVPLPPGFRSGPGGISAGSAPPLGPVADWRATPKGGLLLLQGIPSTAVIPDPCKSYPLWLLWPDGRQLKLGSASSLEGLRWLSPDDPLARSRAWRFLSADQPCWTPFAAQESSPKGHACQIQAVDRPWRGPEDLSASAWLEGGWIHLRFIDDQPTGEERLMIWAGGRRRWLSPIKVGTKGSPPKGRARRSGNHWRIELPYAWLGRPPALGLRFDDPDPEGSVQLWITPPVDLHNRPKPMAL